MYFQRPAFHKRLSYGRTPPKPVWHILVPELEPHVKTARMIVAVCGYEYDNIFMDVKVSKAVKTKPAGDHCKKCERKLEQKATGHL